MMSDIAKQKEQKTCDFSQFDPERPSAAEVDITGQLFAEILRLIARLRPPPDPLPG